MVTTATRILPGLTWARQFRIHSARQFRTHAASCIPRRGAGLPKDLASSRVLVPVMEETLQKMARKHRDGLGAAESIVGEKVLKSKLKIHEGKVKKTKENEPPPPIPVTEENQYDCLAKAVTPLAEVPYFKQLKIKEKSCEKVLKTLRKQLIAVDAPLQSLKNKLPCILEPTRPSPDLVAYRNKDEFGIHFGIDGNPKTVGFFVGRPLDKTMVCVPPTFLINMRETHKKVAQSFQTYIRQSPHEVCHHFDVGGVWKNLVVRSTDSGEMLVSVIIHPRQLTEDQIQEIMEDLRRFFFNGEGSECEVDSLYLQACPHTRCTREQAPYRLIAGKEHITESCCDLLFQISPDSFFQVNTRGAECLYSTVREIAEVSPLTTLLDICCGTGTISQMMSPYVRGTIGIDSTTAAIDDARKNATINNVNNSIFIAGKAEEVLPKLTIELSQSTDVVAVVNPARGGLHKDVIYSLRQCDAIHKLIYISCKPDGVAMDNFVKLGSMRGLPPKIRKTSPFIPKYAVPVDMFPHTDHTELVIFFERLNSGLTEGG